MNSTEIERQLILSAAALARTASREWSVFLDALTKYEQIRLINLVSSPADTLMISQGQAREVRYLLAKFNDCRQTAEQIVNKGK